MAAIADAEARHDLGARLVGSTELAFRLHVENGVVERLFVVARIEASDVVAVVVVVIRRLVERALRHVLRRLRLLRLRLLLLLRRLPLHRILRALDHSLHFVE